jgi:fermentation-respiration switch protein FrsA (DUF1100 family)/quercetin dioxygenase-like cupin family protein
MTKVMFVLLAIIILVPCTIAGSMAFSQTAEDLSQGTGVSEIGSQTDPVADIASNNTEDALSTYTQKDSNMATGNAWFKKLDTDLENNSSRYVVTFEPGARNHWHSYPGEQILFGVEGNGYYQEEGKPGQLLHPGETVTTTPNVKHWYGATEDGWFELEKIITNPQGGDVEPVWFEAVNEQDYNNLVQTKFESNERTFPLSENVTVEKVSFPNRYGITLVAEMYLSKDMDRSQKYPAIIVGTPYGGVKEQGAGIYAQEMAERGFVALAFDQSYNGESSGEPRRISSPEIFTEDFSAAVDFIGTREFVDRDKIGVIGMCGSGGFALNAAQVDTRIKAIAPIVMYDMSRVKALGWMDAMTEEQRQDYLDQIGQQRWAEFEGGEVKMVVGTPETIDENTDPIGREFYEYYREPRGEHPRSTTEMTMTSDAAFMNFPLLYYIESISPRPILFVTGEVAHSKYFTDDTYEMAAEPKELYVVPGAGHVDLYDKVDLIPFDKLESFFRSSLNA